MADSKFDLLVIGSGPAGQKGAIAAAKLGKRVAVIDRQEMIGGVSLHTGTIPSKTLREAILYLSGFRQRTFYGIYTIPEISMIGKTEQELTAAKVPYKTGIAKYEELARAQMLGDETGLLKILFDLQSL
jgi:NAD(P) transhydrogenase